MTGLFSRFCLPTGRSRTKFFYRCVAGIVLFTFSFWSVMPPSATAQVLPGLLNLPAPGSMVMTTPNFSAPMIYGMSMDPVNPLKFDFFVHKGDKKLAETELRKEAQRLIKYFLATLTTPEDELWVNLSPNEADRIISDNFGVTEMGRDMLAQDYLLKQLTASLTYPEDELGKKFWDRVYQQAKEKFGTNDIPLDNFHKVWIVPERAKVLEKDGHVFILDARLKVMMEEDYVALQNNRSPDPQNPSAPERVLTGEPGNRGTGELTKLQTEIMREIILPEIEKEVNEGKNFSTLRQIFYSMILATWYKKNLRETLLGRIYVDQNKIAGVDVEDKQIKEKIYAQYLETLKQGVFNYIKEDYDLRTNEIVPRQYFSGGMNGSELALILQEAHWASPAEQQRLRQLVLDEVRVPTVFVETDGSQAREDAVRELVAQGETQSIDSAMLGGMRPWLKNSIACLGFGLFSSLVSSALTQNVFAQFIDQPFSTVAQSQEKETPDKLVLDIRSFTAEEQAHFNLILQIIRNFDPESLKILTDLIQSGRLSIAIASEESMKQLVMVAKSMDPLAKQEAAIHIGGVTIYEWQHTVNGKPSYTVFINERANAVEFLMFTLHELAGHVAQDELHAYGWTLPYEEKEIKAHSVEKAMLETLVENRARIIEAAAVAGMPFSDVYWLEDALQTARMNRRVSDIEFTLDRRRAANEQGDGQGQIQLPERNQDVLALQDAYDFIDFHALTKIENQTLAAEIARELKKGLDMVEAISTHFLRSGLSDKRLFVTFDEEKQEIAFEFPEDGSDRHVIPVSQLPDLWKYIVHDNVYFGGLPDEAKALFMEIDHAPRNEAIRGKIERRIGALKSKNWKEFREGAPSESAELDIEASFVADRHFEQYRDEYLGLVPEKTLNEPMRMFFDALINSGTVPASVIPARHSWKVPAIMIAVMGAGAVGFGVWRHGRNKRENASDENADSAMLAVTQREITRRTMMGATLGLGAVLVSGCLNSAVWTGRLSLEERAVKDRIDEVVGLYGYDRKTAAEFHRMISSWKVSQGSIYQWLTVLSKKPDLMSFVALQDLVRTNIAGESGFYELGYTSRKSKGNCVGKALVFDILARAAGFHSETVSWHVPKAGAHIVNLVRLQDGTYVLLDVGFDRKSLPFEWDRTYTKRRALWVTTSGVVLSSMGREYQVVRRHDMNGLKAVALGWAAVHETDPKKNIEITSRGIELDAESASLYWKRGEAKRELGDKEGAMRDYEKAILLSPDYHQYTPEDFMTDQARELIEELQRNFRGPQFEDDSGDSAMLAELQSAMLDTSEEGQGKRITAAKQYLADARSRTNKSGNMQLLYQLWDLMDYRYDSQGVALYDLIVQKNSMRILAMFLKADAIEVESLQEFLLYRIDGVRALEVRAQRTKPEIGATGRGSETIDMATEANKLLTLLKEKKAIHAEGSRGMIAQQDLIALFEFKNPGDEANAIQKAEALARAVTEGKLAQGAVYNLRTLHFLLRNIVSHFFDASSAPVMARDLTYEQISMIVFGTLAEAGLVDRDAFFQAVKKINADLRSSTGIRSGFLDLLRSRGRQEKARKGDEIVSMDMKYHAEALYHVLVGQNLVESAEGQGTDSAMLGKVEKALMETSPEKQEDRIAAARQYLESERSKKDPLDNSQFWGRLWDAMGLFREATEMSASDVQVRQNAMRILSMFLEAGVVDFEWVGEFLRYRLDTLQVLEQAAQHGGPAAELLTLLKEKGPIPQDGSRSMIAQTDLRALYDLRTPAARERALEKANELGIAVAQGRLPKGAIYDSRSMLRMLRNTVIHFVGEIPARPTMQELIQEEQAMIVLRMVAEAGLIGRQGFARAVEQINAELSEQGQSDFFDILRRRVRRAYELYYEDNMAGEFTGIAGEANALNQMLIRQKLNVPVVVAQGQEDSAMLTEQQRQDQMFVAPGVDADIFKGKVVGITGGSGYIAASLIQRYLDAGVKKVVIMDNNIRNREEIAALEGVAIEEVDIADTKTLRTIFQKYHFDHITHLAADIEAGVSMKRPAFYHWNNVLNTRRLLGVMNEFDIKGITFASSAGVYEGLSEPLTEDVNVNPQNVYGATKRMMEKMMRDFSRKRGIRFAALRFFNVAGAFEWEINGLKVILGENHRGRETHIIPVIFEVLQGKRPYFMMFGGDYATRDGSNVRDYIHVLDLANAIVRSASWTMSPGQQEDLIMNLGTKNGTSNFEILETVQRVTGKTFHRLEGRELETIKRYIKDGKKAEAEQFAAQMKAKYHVDAVYFVTDRRSGDADSLTANPERAKEKLDWVAVHSDVETVIRDAWKYQSREDIANAVLPESETVDIEATETAYILDIVDEISGDAEISRDVQFEELFRVFIDSLYDPKYDFADRDHQLPIYNAGRDILAKQQPVLQSVLDNAEVIKLVKDQPLAESRRGNALREVRSELLNMIQGAQESSDVQAFIESFGSDSAMLSGVFEKTIIAPDHFSLKITVKDEEGLHMRPAMAIVKKAQELGCKGSIKNGETQANLTSIMEVSTLAAGPGAVLIFDIQGENSEGIIPKLAEILGWTAEEIDTALSSEPQPGPETEGADHPVDPDAAMLADELRDAVLSTSLENQTGRMAAAQRYLGEVAATPADNMELLFYLWKLTGFQSLGGNGLQGGDSVIQRTSMDIIVELLNHEGTLDIEAFRTFLRAHAGDVHRLELIANQRLPESETADKRAVAANKFSADNLLVALKEKGVISGFDAAMLAAADLEPVLDFAARREGKVIEVEEEISAFLSGDLSAYTVGRIYDNRERADVVPLMTAQQNAAQDEFFLEWRVAFDEAPPARFTVKTNTEKMARLLNAMIAKGGVAQGEVWDFLEQTAPMFLEMKMALNPVAGLEKNVEMAAHIIASHAIGLTMKTIRANGFKKFIGENADDFSLGEYSTESLAGQQALRVARGTAGAEEFFLILESHPGSVSGQHKTFYYIKTDRGRLIRLLSRMFTQGGEAAAVAMEFMRSVPKANDYWEEVENDLTMMLEDLQSRIRRLLPQYAGHPRMKELRQRAGAALENLVALNAALLAVYEKKMSETGAETRAVPVRLADGGVRWVEPETREALEHKRDDVRRALTSYRQQLRDLDRADQAMLAQLQQRVLNYSAENEQDRMQAAKEMVEWMRSHLDDTPDQWFWSRLWMRANWVIDDGSEGTIGHDSLLIQRQAMEILTLFVREGLVSPGTLKGVIAKNERALKILLYRAVVFAPEQGVKPDGKKHRVIMFKAAGELVRAMQEKGVLPLQAQPSETAEAYIPALLHGGIRGQFNSAVAIAARVLEGAMPRGVVAYLEVIESMLQQALHTMINDPEEKHFFHILAALFSTRAIDRAAFMTAIAGSDLPGSPAHFVYKLRERAEQERDVDARLLYNIMRENGYIQEDSAMLAGDQAVDYLGRNLRGKVVVPYARMQLSHWREFPYQWKRDTGFGDKADVYSSVPRPVMEFLKSKTKRDGTQLRFVRGKILFKVGVHDSAVNRNGVAEVWEYDLTPQEFAGLMRLVLQGNSRELHHFWGSHFLAAIREQLKGDEIRFDYTTREISVVPGARNALAGSVPERQDRAPHDGAMLAQMMFEAGNYVEMIPIWIGGAIMTVLAVAPHGYRLAQALRGSREREQYPWVWELFEKRVGQHPEAPVAGVHKMALFHQAVSLYRQGYNFVLMEKTRSTHPLRWELHVLKGARLESRWLSMRKLLGRSWPAHVYEEVDRQAAHFNTHLTPAEKGALYEKALQNARAGLGFKLRFQRTSGVIDSAASPMTVEIVAVNPLTKEVVPDVADRAMLSKKTAESITQEVLGKHVFLALGYSPERWDVFPYQWYERRRRDNEPTRLSTIPNTVAELLRELADQSDVFDESGHVLLSWLSYETKDGNELAKRDYEILTGKQFANFLRALSGSTKEEEEDFFLKGMIPAVQKQMSRMDLNVDLVSGVISVRERFQPDQELDDESEVQDQIRKIRKKTSAHDLRKHLDDPDLDPRIREAMRKQLRTLSRTRDDPDRKIAVRAQKYGLDAPGGIDFNPALFDLEIKRDESGVPLPMDMQSMPELMNIQGFVPVILEILPATNVPMLLGLTDEVEQKEELSFRPSDRLAIFERKKNNS